MADLLTGAAKRDELLHGKLTDAEIGDRLGISEATAGEARARAYGARPKHPRDDLAVLDQLADIMAQFEALVDDAEADGFLGPEDIRNARAGCDRYRVAADEARAKALGRKRAAKVDSRHGAQRAGSRPRGAGRPRAAAVRSSVRSGDSGDDPPGSSSAAARCSACGSVLLLASGAEVCANRRCSRYGEAS